MIMVITVVTSEVMKTIVMAKPTEKDIVRKATQNHVH